MLEASPVNYALYSDKGKAAHQYRTRLFNGNEVRLREENGNVWFVADDVCGILGYKNTSQAIQMHCDKVAREEDLAEGKELAHKIDIETDGGKQAMIAIGEPDLYRLIFRSKKEEARQFEGWVVEEVLPEIRKTGHYKVTRKLDYTPAPTQAGAAEEPSAQVELFPRIISASLPKPLTDKLNEAKKRLAVQGHTFPTNKDYLAYLLTKALEAIG
ncbi:MAG: BRO family protein [Sphaerochaetaceae bacterium]